MTIFSFLNALQIFQLHGLVIQITLDKMLLMMSLLAYVAKHLNIISLEILTSLNILVFCCRDFFVREAGRCMVEFNKDDGSDGQYVALKFESRDVAKEVYRRFAF